MCLCVRTHFPLPCVYVFVSQKKKKRMGNCPTLLKRVCCVQYNLPHPPLKVTMAFEWSCGVPLCQNFFPSPLCVCVFVSLKKKKTWRKEIFINSFKNGENCIPLLRFSIIILTSFMVNYIHSPPLDGWKKGFKNSKKKRVLKNLKFLIIGGVDNSLSRRIK